MPTTLGCAFIVLCFDLFRRYDIIFRMLLVEVGGFLLLPMFEHEIWVEDCYAYLLLD